MTIRPCFSQRALSIPCINLGVLPWLSPFHTPDPNDAYQLSGEQRKLGLLVARGTSVMTVFPVNGVAPIDNPFVEQP